MILDHTPIPIEGFLGLYGTDSFGDSVPPNYSIDELNLISFGIELRTRNGFGVSNNINEGVSWFSIYRIQGQASRILILIGDTIHDLTTGVDILTVAGMTGFAIGFFNGRAYISPHNGNSGVPGSFVFVYDGTGTARKAAGSSPSGGFNVIVSGTIGVIEAGLHIFAWVFETSSGFVTAPSESQILEFDGDNAADFSSIPLGPVGTATRRLIASRAIQEFNGDMQGYEMFFVAGGRINDNTTTILNGVDFYDADLIVTADYTFDQLSEIPAVCFIVPYGFRMCFGGPDNDKNLVYVSKPLEPESVNSQAGFITCDPFETEGVKDAVEFRNNLYITKRNKTYVTMDNGYDAATWKPITIDASIGADINGIASFYDSKGSKVEWFVATGPAGINKFTGTYDELPISRNIKNLWRDLTPDAFNLGKAVFDQEKLLFYVLISKGTASPNYILVGNYENGFTWDRIRWHLWAFTDFSPSCIGLDRDSNRKTQLNISSLSGNIYRQEEKRRDDNLFSIPQFIQFNHAGGTDNGIYHAGGIGLRCNGEGTVTVELFGEDNIDYQLVGNLTLMTRSGRDWLRQCHFQTERVSLKLTLSEPSSYIQLKKAILYLNEVFASRPI